jgi:hypothetical protein
MPTTLDLWTHGREPIAMRWWITRSGEVRPGWPAPGLEQSTLAMGWIARNTLIGVIEHPGSPIDNGLLEILEQRFPNRRWFAGDWHRQDETHRRAA